MVSHRLLAMSTVLAALACSPDTQVEAQSPPPLPSGSRTVSATVDASRRTAIVEATSRAAPSVVSVRAVVRRQVNPSAFDAFFFGGTREQTSQSFGTGFIIREDGIILTNQHVIAGSEQLTVTLADGSDVEARLLGEDPLTDIAVLKINRENLPVVAVGQSENLLIGEWAIALGNPYSFLLGNSEPTVTAGVISATGRNILPSGGQRGRYYDMIQTDAAINPGNSGGPLVNVLGEVIGVSSSIFSNTGESVGVGFAIPIERAMRVAGELVRNGSVRRAWVGLEVAGADQMGEWKRAGGVPVAQVVPDGPAARAGLTQGDVLLTANGRRLHNYLDWEAMLLDLHVGDQVDVTALRGTRELSLRIVPADLPTVTAERVRLRGLDLVTLTPAIRAELRSRAEAGAALLHVPTETARLTGLRDGDVIVRIDYVRDRREVQAPIASASDMAAVLDRIASGQQFRLWYERGGQFSYIVLTN